MSPLCSARGRAPSPARDAHSRAASAGHLARQDVAQHAVPLLEHQRLALGRLDERGAVDPLDAAAGVGLGVARQHGRARAVAEQAGADQHAGVVVEIHRGAAHLDADREHVPAAPEASSARPSCRLGKRRGAALADQVEGLHVGAQAEPLDDVARQARAEVAGAGADDDRVDRGQRGRRGQRPRRRLGGERRRVARNRRSSVSGSIANTSSSESSARRRASMPLSRCRTVRAIRCERVSRRANHSERWNASRHSALV